METAVAATDAGSEATTAPEQGPRPMTAARDLPEWPDEPAFITTLRRQAWERYASLPMPTRKTEEWRYTDLSGLDPDEFRPLAPEGLTIDSAEDLPEAVQGVITRDRHRAGIMVELNGAPVYLRLDPELEGSGLVYGPIAEVVRRHPRLIKQHLFQSAIADMEQKLWSLHVALLTGGYVVYVPRGLSLPAAIHNFHYIDRSGELASTHALIIAEPGAEVTVIDEFISPDLDAPSLSLGGVEIFGQDQATVRYLALQRYGRGVKHFSMQHATSQRGTRLAGYNVTLGADLSRSDVTSHLEGQESDSEMLALWFGDRGQHFDYQTLQHPAAPNAHSDLLYKGALTDSADSVFRGLIRVDPGAQLTDAYQTNRNLLLSEDSHATSLPNLEIEADDVRCSHGATVGQVDENMLFYLMSRGLDRQQAERLLVFGFFDEVLKRIPVEGVRKRIGEAIEEKIGL
ncbi:MAG: Fe-S cluster assembly protein SufD [Gemmatimonadales bacterium]